MSNIKNIEKFIDKILEKKRWTEKEMEFYELLQKKIMQYQDRPQTFELIQDKQEIIKNIQEQTWYMYSKYKPILNSLLNEMEIESYEFMGQAGILRNRLIVKFPRSKFWLQSYFSLEWDPNTMDQYQVKKQQLQYYFYLEDFNQVKRAYLAYNDNLDTHNLNKDIKLPQLGEIFDIIKIGAYVSKIELVKLFSEIVLYFDESEYIAKTHIGQNYPITLTYFLNNL